jgi:transposase
MEPTALTEAVHTALVETARKGLPKSTAAKMVGIGRKSLYRWLDRGQDDLEAGRDTAYSRFAAEYGRAEARWEEEMLELVARAAEENSQNWAAAMTALERRNPREYGRRDTTVIEGGERPVQLVEISNPEVRELSLRLLELTAAPRELEEGEYRELPDD